ncbi:hypothetical protein CRYUN_Cryun40dG0020200 [Craigia yunnanensis]
MNVCTESLEYTCGSAVHGFIIKSDWSLALEAKNSILSFYAKLGRMDVAMKEFESVGLLSQVSWYARNWEGEQAFSFFVQMVRNCICPDDFTFGAVLHACSSLAVLGFGKMVHGYVIRYGFQAFVYVGNGLVNMYAKCGDTK